MVSKEKRFVLFRSHYCLGCNQRKSCGLLNSEYCCSCYYQEEKEKAMKHNSYEKVLADQRKDQQVRIRQLKLLRDYQGCKDCGSLAVDAYELYENSGLVCQPCLVRKEGGASSPISFLEQSQWYQTSWGINLGEWLNNYGCLPINANCAKKWLKNKQHLKNCACLELEATKIYELLANSLKRAEAKIKKCACETSQKVRVSYYDLANYGYTYCEKCEARIKGAGKMGVIKNRHDPKFWGLKVKERILCGECLKGLVGQMPAAKKYTFNKYLKRGYWR